MSWFRHSSARLTRNVTRLLRGNKDKPNVSNLPMMRRIKAALVFHLKPKAIVFGFSLFYYISDRVAWERLMSSCDPLPCYPGDHTPSIGIPFKLLCAALALVVNRWWGNLIAMVISGNFLYEYGYLLLIECANSHDQPVLSWSALDCWSQHIVNYYSPHLIDFTLALIIFSFSTMSLVRYICRGSRLRFYR